MEKLGLRKFYKLPDKIFFILNIAILVITLLAIATIWVSNTMQKWAPGMTFAAFTTCVVLAWGIIGIIHPEKKIRKYAIGYFILIGLHILCWILTCFHERIPWVGVICETIVYTSMFLLAGYILLEPHIAHGKVKVVKKIKTVETPKEEPRKEAKKEIEKSQPEHAVKPVEKPKDKPASPIIHVSME